MKPIIHQARQVLTGYRLKLIPYTGEILTGTDDFFITKMATPIQPDSLPNEGKSHRYRLKRFTTSYNLKKKCP
ncbi:hypothetical protein ACL6C3_23015 [Capilliphycus salinus ALCB114379]|uniref:hypothetical protein n=1 Tax=Capilliphycus salinus TaxID=2768948 RepID=UPI0039A6897F